MKCPNCSFQNPPGSDECKICGYELSTPTQEKPPRKKSIEDDDDLDKTFDELFGSTEKAKSQTKLDSRFEEYAEMADDDEPYVNESPFVDKDNWLHDIQRDIDAVENEFDTLRFSRKRTPETQPSDETETLTDDTPILSENEIREDLSNETIEELRDETSDDLMDDTLDELRDENKDDLREGLLDDSTGVVDEIIDDGIIHLNFNITGDSESQEPTPLPYEAYEEMVDQDELDESIHDKHKKHFANPNAIRNRIIVIGIALILLILLLFKVFTPGSNEPNVAIDTTVSKEEEDDETTQDTSETDYNHEIADQTGFFFNQLQAYVNNGNIAVLSMFVDSQDALEQLSTFKKQGTLDDFDITIPEIEMIVPVETSEPDAYVIIKASLVRTISGEQVTKDSDWSFEWAKRDGTWRIKALTINSEYESISVAPDTNDSTSTSSNTSTTTTTPSPNQTTTETEARRPDGFISKGSFTGGIVTDGQDVADIRFGKHETFERLVFDMAKWTGSTPTELVDDACHYVATISDDGLKITLELSGVRGASASSPSLTNSIYFKSVQAQFPEDDSAVTFIITLNEGVDFKVFTLSDPGKIIVDVAPHEN